MANTASFPIECLDQDQPLADWLVALGHDSPFEQPQAEAARGGTSVALSAVPNLLSLIDDSSRHVRLGVVRALGDLGGEVRRVLPALHAALEEAALHDRDCGVRAEAARALLRAGPRPVTELAALVDALHSDIDLVRFHAAMALGDFGVAGRPAVPSLIHASLWDEERAVRVAAAMALWKIDDRRTLVLHVLINALDDPNELLCWIAVDFLGQMGPAARQAVPVLRRILRRSFRISLIKRGVMRALELINPEAAAQAG